MNKKRHLYQRGAMHFSLAILLAGAISVGTFFTNTFNNLFNHPADTAPVATVQTQNQVAATTSQPSVAAKSSTAVSTSTQKATTTTTGKDCGTDMNCFIAQAGTCGPASVEFTADIIDDVTATSHLVIGKSSTAGSCTFNQRTDKIAINGEDQSEEVGSVVACPAIPSSKLTALLTNWNEDTFSSDDFAGYNCKTTLPKALIDAINTPSTPDPDSDMDDAAANSNHEVLGGMGAGSTVGRNGYQFNVTAVTSNSVTLQLRGQITGDTTTAPVMVTLVQGVPQTYFGYTFAMSGITSEYGHYIATVTVDKLQ